MICVNRNCRACKDHFTRQVVYKECYSDKDFMTDCETYKEFQKQKRGGEKYDKRKTRRTLSHSKRNK